MSDLGESFVENGTETIMKMMEMQKTYDELVFKAHMIHGYDDIDIDSALLDEIGELNHELKANWCWWKFSQKPVDKEAALEEFADVMHFVLMQMISVGFDRNEISNDLTDFVKYCNHLLGIDMYYCGDPVQMVVDMVNSDYIRLFTAGMEMFNLKWNDVFEIYSKKNAINVQRVKDGY